MGQSPFQPDREHLHHICQRIGLSPGATLIFICSMVSICAAIGLWADFTDVSESTMFLAFIILFACYFSIISHIESFSMDKSYVQKAGTNGG